ncbi:MAG TPA: hypothetical protein PLH22_01600 [Candidatus Colwellbacteria bacterium]|jgi:hypothetical protein|nr:hypothetical protein [Candidatus Colwellbacteria bacterium]
MSENLLRGIKKIVKTIGLWGRLPETPLVIGPMALMDPFGRPFYEQAIGEGMRLRSDLSARGEYIPFGDLFPPKREKK